MKTEININYRAWAPEQGFFGSWDAAFYSDNIVNGDKPWLEGKADVGDLASATEEGWFEDAKIKFADDAVICFVTCRGAQEDPENGLDFTIASQITFKNRGYHYRCFRRSKQ